jgi:hypothetical protein
MLNLDQSLGAQLTDARFQLTNDGNDPSKISSRACRGTLF